MHESVTLHVTWFIVILIIGLAPLQCACLRNDENNKKDPYDILCWIYHCFFLFCSVFFYRFGIHVSLYIMTQMSYAGTV